ASAGASFAKFANLTSSLLQELPPSLQPYLDTALGQLLRASDYLQSTTGLSPATLCTTAGAVLLLGAIPAVATRKGQNKRGKGGVMSRYGWSRGDSGLSPYASTLGQGGVPAVTEDDFSYITSQDLETEGIDSVYGHNIRDADSYAHAAPSPTPAYSHSPPEDDVLLVRHKGVTYPEHFPAYAIGDGKLFVSDVKARVGIFLNLPERRYSRIKLFYKGRILDDDNQPIRVYGVKNNSEVLVSIPDFGAGSSDDSGEEVVVEQPLSKSQKKRRGRKQKSRSPQDSTSTLSLEVPGEDERSRGTSRIRTKSVSSSAGVSRARVGPTPAPIVPGGVPGGPYDKMNTIATNFNENLLPMCQQYAANPPLDEKKNKEEHAKASELVLTQVLMKLDGVETDGDDGARARRRALVKHVQAVLTMIDEVKSLTTKT
ncbi:BAG domain-containing protein, partial [Podospora appendiculata]